MASALRLGLASSIRGCLFSSSSRQMTTASRGLPIVGRSTALLPSFVTPMAVLPWQTLPPPTSQAYQQIRNASMTKTKKRQEIKMLKREARVKKGLPEKPLPPRYIPKDTPVVNALTREERDAESASFDKAAAEEMKVKIKKSKETLRFDFTDLVMSDRVRKLFDLTNGSQMEVVKAQKQRGMELFQLREGDTGSSAVQVVALTTRIQQMQTHMATHKKDNSSKRGMDALYVRRRKLLDYMERKDFESYRRVVKSLGLMR